MGQKLCLMCRGKTLGAGVVNRLSKTKYLLTSPSNVLPYHLQAIFLYLFYFNKPTFFGIALHCHTTLLWLEKLRP